MKTDFLKALGISDEQAAEILKENGKDIEKHKATAEANLAKVTVPLCSHAILRNCRDS